METMLLFFPLVSLKVGVRMSSVKQRGDPCLTNAHLVPRSAQGKTPSSCRGACPLGTTVRLPSECKDSKFSSFVHLLFCQKDVILSEIDKWFMKLIIYKKGRHSVERSVGKSSFQIKVETVNKSARWNNGRNYPRIMSWMFLSPPSSSVEA